MKCMEFYSPDGGSLHYHTHWLSTFIQSCWSLFEILLQTATQEQGSYSCIQDPTHYLRDKHLARPLINKNKYKETIFLPCLDCLLKNKSVNKQYELQKGQDSEWWNKLMPYMQDITHSGRKENNVYQPHSNYIHQIYSNYTEWATPTDILILSDIQYSLTSILSSQKLAFETVDK